MQGKRCLGTLDVLREVLDYGRRGAALLIVLAALGGASGAAGSTCKAIHVFTSTARGANPTRRLTFDAAGNLYGATASGGSQGCGVVFEMKPNADSTWSYGVLYDLKGGHYGCQPHTGLIFDAAGNLYGTAALGGTDGRGVVFKLAPNPDGTWTESVLHSFSGTDGSNPWASLVFDAAGNLYSTTPSGGSYGDGVVFKLKPNPDGTWTGTVLHSFTGADGAVPFSALIFDAAGNLYGTAADGGADGHGVVFKLAPNPDGTWTESVLYSFSGGADGGGPGEFLIADAAGNLYSTTGVGGAYGEGVVFKLAPNPDGTWTQSVLHSFTGKDGAIPGAGLIFDTAGNLYGTTYGGGAAGDGVVFKLTPSSKGWSETVLHSFLGFGKNPTAPVIFDPAGNLYGTTESGNTNNGLVFKLTP